MAPITIALAISACLTSSFALGQSDPLTEAVNQAGMGSSPGGDPGSGLGAASLGPSGGDSGLMGGELQPRGEGGNGNTALPGLDDSDNTQPSSTSAECTGAECAGEEDSDVQESDARRTAAKSSEGCGDIDKDGVCDDNDSCLNTSEGAPTMPNGCHLDRAAPLLLEGVRFDEASARLAGRSRAALDQAVAMLKANPEVLVTVDGHTDNTGSREENQRLSLERAESVYRYFIEQGIAEERLAFRGFGQRRPRAPNTFEDDRDYPAGRAQNRRVELSVVAAEEFAAVREQNAEREQARALAQEAEARRRNEALEAERQAEVRREKTERAEEDYQEVLEFMEESGAAKSTATIPESSDKHEKKEAIDEGNYFLEVTEPEL